MRRVWVVVLSAAVLSGLRDVQAQASFTAADAPPRPIPIALNVSTGPTATNAADLAREMRARIQADFGAWFREASEAEAQIVVSIPGVYIDGARIQVRVADLYQTTIRREAYSCFGLIGQRVDCLILARNILEDLQAIVVALQRAASRGRDLWSTGTGSGPLAATPTGGAPVTGSPSTAGPCQRVRAPEKDPGMDIAYVKIPISTLRAAPNATATKVRDLPCQSLLVLVSRDQAGTGWFNVVDADSSDEGWISAGEIDVHLTKETRTTPFQQQRVGGDAPPSVEVTNDTDRELSLTVGDQKHQIAAKSTVKITVKPGAHKYIASAPGVLPLAGTDTWEAGTVYTWRFYIVTR